MFVHDYRQALRNDRASLREGRPASVGMPRLRLQLLKMTLSGGHGPKTGLEILIPGASGQLRKDYKS
jgi:hypothetical protein